MITKGIKFSNFKEVKNLKKIKKKFDQIINNKNEVIKSLTKNYVYSFKKKQLKKYKKFSSFRLIGMGGSVLGTQTIYEFLKHEIKKNFVFVDNLQNTRAKSKKKFVNLIVSKSGNTIETIVNSNILIKKKDKNIFITEHKKNYLFYLKKKKQKS